MWVLLIQVATLRHVIHGGIIASLFFVFMHGDTVKVHKLLKKRMSAVSSHRDRTSLVKKGIIVWFLGNFSCGTPCGSPEWAR